MPELNFADAFKSLTGNAPFPWQRDLYEKWFSQGRFPASCNLPTGLGKTSVIAVWLIALANGCAVPRRLVYVVNRRTVVDQTTTEVENCRDRSAVLGLPEKLAISTLRGQYADNREWSGDPSRPAVICGTVDMIGSRLLFGGYGCGFKTRPLHAGFLGQDSLIVHDEAHLEPAFQELLLAIEHEQHNDRRTETGKWIRGEKPRDFRPLRVMELTATSRAGAEKPFELTPADYEDPTVRERVNAKKKLHLHENHDAKKLAEEIARKAKECGDRFPGSAVIVFVRTVKDVKAVTDRLPAGSFETLTGTLRGYERDRLVGRPIFQRFLPDATRDEKNEKTVYLVCTSAGEVGVNISADHLVCDLSTFESMTQRFGRVNRFGKNDATEIHVIRPTEFDDDDNGRRLRRTLGLLELLGGNASPAALGELRAKAVAEGSSTTPATSDAAQALRDYVNAHQGEDARLGGFAAPPVILPTSDILFDAWALTSASRPLVKADLPGRPPVEPYLHGVEDEKKRETQVAWRAEVSLFKSDAVTEGQIGELLDAFPLRPHELLRDATYRVQDELAALAKAHGESPVWVIDPDDTVRVLKLRALAEENNKGYAVNLSARVVVLPPAAGGLTKTGMLSGTEGHNPEREYDVGGRFLPASKVPLVRLLVSRTEDQRTYRLANDAPVLNLPAGFSFPLESGESERELLRRVFAKEAPEPFPAMRAAYRIDLQGAEDEPTDGPVAYLVLKPEAVKKGSQHAAAWPSLDGHNQGVEEQASAIASRLNLPPDVATAAGLAGRWHDLGKSRAVWQRGAGNKATDEPVAKTLHGRPPENLNHFRHELASLIDVNCDPEYSATLGKESEECRELLLHLIATHHGRGRPHFPAAEADDPERPDAASRAVVTATPQRFAKLQRKYGRWGLAYLESLLRAADALDSKRIEETPIGARVSGEWRGVRSGFAVPAAAAPPVPSISVAVDPTNPGQFFACCGLLELADRLWPGAEGWFADGKFHVACSGTLAELTTKLVDVGLASALTPALEAERENLEQRKRELKRERQTLPKHEESRRKELGTLFREGSIRVGAPFNLLLDWWQSDDESNPKTWAGSQAVIRIASAALVAMAEAVEADSPLDYGCVMRAPPEEDEQEGNDNEADKVEPFYFDARRAPNAHSRDIGFSPNDLDRMTTTAFPAVEFLCLAGLQRCLPAKTDVARIYDYFTWAEPLPPALLPAAVTGLLPHIGARGYRFENWFRTGQRKHKAFRSATPLSPRGAR